MKERRTDYGTVILHWLFVAALGVAFVTGLRIATFTISPVMIHTVIMLEPP